MHYEDFVEIYREAGERTGAIWVRGEPRPDLALTMVVYLTTTYEYSSAMKTLETRRDLGVPREPAKALMAEFEAAAHAAAVTDEATAEANARAFAIELAERSAEGTLREEYRAVVARLGEEPVITREAAARYLEYYKHADLNSGILQQAVEARARARREISAEAVALTERLSAEPNLVLSRVEGELLAGEVGRLIGPLLGASRYEERPKALTQALAIVKTVVVDRAEGWREFNVVSESWRDLDPGEVAERAAEAALRDARYHYLRDFPAGGALPSDPRKAEAEAERRIALRKEHTDTALRTALQLLEPWASALNARLAAVADEQRRRIEAAEAELAARQETLSAAPRPPMPPAQEFGVSARGAELWCQQALLALGIHDAVVTRQSADGGQDIYSDAHRLSVSVKNYAGTVDVIACREIFGVAVAQGRRALLMTSGGLTRDAESFCLAAPVAVIHYDVAAALLRGLNDLGRVLVDAGAPAMEQWPPSGAAGITPFAHLAPSGRP
ncbi:restriction endonuclease [Leifsonia virtsii]|uniref:Restriction endonuclease n=1 Tax=Leifsonia virtsii TaxID=3035915 RepID=A0ABT8IZX0_9MICO|nr:restriction endonuclease [Leifsonia virtsii]MDN4597584.1 restriction endonuclease [Leifsonia virtsii]